MPNETAATLQPVSEFQISVEQISGYEFRVRFDKQQYPELLMDEPAPPAQQLWYTPREQARVRRSLKDPVVNGRAAWRAAWMWAAKEALYKVCNRGEGFDPRQTEILAQAWWYRTRSWAPPERVCWKNAAQLALMIWIPETHLTQVHP